jgi:hypothetical protein
MSETWLPIRYREFYDIPRAFVVEFQGASYFFDCPFNEDLDNHETEYSIYKITEELCDRIDSISWTDIVGSLKRVGTVRVSDVEFDTTKRQAIKARVLKPLHLS